MGGLTTCIFCGKVFQQPHKYRAHLFTHTHEKPFTCEECDTEFATSFSLERHRKERHLGIQEKCVNCGQLFNSGALYRHKQKGCQGDPEGEKRPAFVASQQTNVPKKGRISRRKLEDTPKGEKGKGIRKTTRSDAEGAQRTNHVAVEKAAVNARKGRVSVKPDLKEPVPLPNSSNPVHIVPEAEEEGGVKTIVEEKMNEDIGVPSPGARNEEESQITTPVCQSSSPEKLPTVQTEETVKNIPASVPSTPTETVTAAAAPQPPPSNLSPDSILMPPPPVPPAGPAPSRVPPHLIIPAPARVSIPNIPTLTLPPVPPKVSVDLIVWNPDTDERVPVSSPAAQTLLPSNSGDARRPPHPNNLFFMVNGQVDMPLLSVKSLRFLGRKRGLPTSSSLSSSSEDEDESSAMQQETTVQTRSPPPPPPSSTTGARVHGQHLMNDERPFECSTCGSRFKGACHLATHMKTHTKGDCKYGCYFCAGSYHSNSAVVYHIAVQHSTRRDGSSSQYYCPFCERAGRKKVFKDQKLFKQHIRTHTTQEGRHSPVKTLASPAASTPAPRKTVSRRHASKSKPRKALEKGNVVKKHQCSYCSFTGRDRTQLRTHERTHTGERPFPCRFCSQKFNQKANLVYHCINMHCRVREVRASKLQFACKFKCGLTVNTKQEMYRHIVSHHGDLLTDSDRVTEETGTRGQKMKRPKKMTRVREESPATAASKETLQESSKVEVEVEPTEDGKTPQRNQKSRK